MANTDSKSTSTSLLDRAKQLDPEAWQRLVQLYGPLVYRWARQVGLQASDAMDVGQEVFRTVAGKLVEFRHDDPNRSFRGWLWGITRNKVREFYRRAATNPATGQPLVEQLEELPPEDSSPWLRADIQAQIVQRALSLVRQDFEPNTWQAFWRTTVGTESAVEIAADLKMTPKAVRQAKYRVLQRLRAEIEHLI